MKKFIITLLAVSVLAACGSKADRDSARIAKREARLAKETAFTLGVDANSVKISNVSGNMYGYRWQAQANGKTYNCSIVGGNFMTWGQTVTPPQCHPIASGETKKSRSKTKNKK
ncbi:hypothetical protein ACERCG_00070 [Mannheimia sp. E30BD]|uniref:hypothetical protein n=1 Tax=Mannheimia sp. E30BD TaxID=3278708 RepID=UPI00359D0095